MAMLVLSVWLLGGCAGIDYVKVPTPTQYSVWTDDEQRRADCMEGIRYYLPRPFLHLKRSVPVAQRTAFVSFRLEENSYVVELPDEAPTWLRRAVPKRLSITQALAAQLAQPGVKGEKALQGAEVTGKPKDERRKEEEKPPSELTARTGFVSDTDPVTRLGEVMDVVYLPDFEEQYVISPSSGLGKADIETKLRNGWAAEIFSQKVDNTNLIPYVIRQVERASDAAAGIFTTWTPLVAGVPPGTIPKMGDLTRALQAAELTPESVQKVLGNVVLLKIAEVKIARPGLYPILKPREIRQWLLLDGVVSGADPQDTFEMFLEQARVPWIRPDMAFVPCPPFTMIGFNVTTDLFIGPASEQISVGAPAAPKKDSEQSSGNDTIGQASRIRVALNKWTKNQNLGGVASTPPNWDAQMKEGGFNFTLRFADKSSADAARETVQKNLILTAPQSVQEKLSVKVSPVANDQSKHDVVLTIESAALDPLDKEIESGTWPK